MNIKLSVYTNRVKGVSGYVICKSGDASEVNVTGLFSQNIKEDILEKLTRGLRACRKFVSHEDILYIEIQNRHLCSWIDVKDDTPEYSSGLDKVYEVLESLDCRYRFIFVKNPIAKVYVNNGKTEVNMQSALDVLSEFK